MYKTGSKALFYLTALMGATVIAFSTGCASGGFKLTRQYAQFINSKNIILRIVLYILTGIVFAVTLLVDMVFFNTIDFWEGRVSQGTYEFKDGNKSFYVQHEIVPETQLKRSTIKVNNETGKLLQTVVLSETAQGEIELYVDGQLRTRVSDIYSSPMMALFDAKGGLLERRALWIDSVIAAR